MPYVRIWNVTALSENSDYNIEEHEENNINVILSCIGFVTQAQETGTVQPKIMVVPFTKEGEDIRTILEEDVNKRIVLTKSKRLLTVADLRLLISSVR